MRITDKRNFVSEAMLRGGRSYGVVGGQPPQTIPHRLGRSSLYTREPNVI